MSEKRNTFNPNDWVPPILATGTWLYYLWQDAHGIHFVPDKWLITLILSPYGARVYQLGKIKLGDALKRLPKKEPDAAK